MNPHGDVGSGGLEDAHRLVVVNVHAAVAVDGDDLVVLADAGDVGGAVGGDARDEDALVVVPVGSGALAAGDGQTEALVQPLERNVVLLKLGGRMVSRISNSGNKHSEINPEIGGNPQRLRPIRIFWISESDTERTKLGWFFW